MLMGPLAAEHELVPVGDGRVALGGVLEHGMSFRGALQAKWRGWMDAGRLA